ncbi:lysozyme inhibitor LprI family protein [Chelativorans sp. YIM 93263]|uniref:lysozyme inhibitor LprI family protein n=1 Tax=Chelativorans sp. YIM 93263 TaxID=2906648 RepID=UPI0023781415|nr:lysozyme inhibitor LprI family protein [Chelativorans sp. YIM 93263]
MADENCADAQDQATLNECAYDAYNTADERLNAEYKAVMKRLGDDDATKSSLIAAQRAWIAYRDAECKFQASGVEGGSIYPTIRAFCLRQLTDARTQDLEDYLRCQEGDLGCPVPAAN